MIGSFLPISILFLLFLYYFIKKIKTTEKIIGSKYENENSIYKSSLLKYMAHRNPMI